MVARAGTGENPAKFLWIRKKFETWEDLKPKLIVSREKDVPESRNPTSDQKWTHNLIPTNDMAYDMHINIVSFGPGACISAIEAHVMEHGLYMLQGKGMYLLNEKWHEVEAGDFIWMKAFCPQVFYGRRTGSSAIPSLQEHEPADIFSVETAEATD